MRGMRKVAGVAVGGSFVLAILSSSACGATIIVQVLPGEGGTSNSQGSVGGDDVGAGASTNGSMGGPTTTPAVSAVTGGQTGPGLDLCATACTAAVGCGVTTTYEQCLAGCNGVSPACVASHQAWLQCLAGTGTFEKPACPGELGCQQALLNDTLCNGGCAGGSCGAGPSGSCACIAMCTAGTYESSCFPDGKGMAACECRANGKLIGKCFGPGEEKFCDAFHSCCAEILFVDG